jgi:hypothetical protein
MAMRETFDPVSFIGTSVTAGIEQATNAFSGYGQGAQGYGKRWGARFADGRTSDLLSHAVFPSLFHQDPRYFYQGSGSTRSRILHAVSYAFIARSDSGQMMPNYSYLLGDMCSGALSKRTIPRRIEEQAWYSPMPRSVLQGVRGRTSYLSFCRNV